MVVHHRGEKFNNLKVYFESSMLENILNSRHGIFEVDVDNLEKYVDDDMHNNKNSTNFYVPPAVLDQIREGLIPSIVLNHDLFSL